MNYHHGYHAGNFADVFKHTILCWVLNYMKKKPTPFCYIDTHSGAGAYELDSHYAQKTHEAEAGVLALLAYCKHSSTAVHDAPVKMQSPETLNDIPEPISSYLAQLVELQHGVLFYPGSPMLASDLLRESDHLILNEKNPAVFDRLHSYFKADPRISLHQRDGYECLPALLPPKEKRGVILIDPPFESPNEAQHMTRVLAKALHRFRQGVYLLWYPLTDKQPVFRLSPEMTEILTGFEYEILTLQCVEPSPETTGLLGTVMLIVNPPFGLKEAITPCIAFWEQLWRPH